MLPISYYTNIIAKRIITVNRCYFVNFLTCVQIGALRTRVPGSPPTVNRSCGLTPGLQLLTKLAMAPSVVRIKQSPWSFVTV